MVAFDWQRMTSYLYSLVVFSLDGTVAERKLAET